MTTRYAEVHKSPRGPGDARPTALQIIQDEGLEGKLASKTILITGVSSGIGIESAKALATTGATLFLAARNLDKARQQLGELASLPQVHLVQLDLASFASIRSCAKTVLAKTSEINIFIANAGLMAPPEGRTEDGFETQFGTNHLGHFLLFNLTRPALLSAASPESNSRVVFLSSIAHRYSEVVFENYNFEGNYDPWAAYGQSKTANLWTANEIDRRYKAQGLRALSVQPGGTATGLAQYISEEERAGLMNDPVLGPQFKSPEQGAATSVWGAVSKSLEGEGGKYLEDLQIAKAYDASGGQWAPGYVEHAYSPEKERRLWELSLKLIGLEGSG